MDVPAVLKRSARYAWGTLAFLMISYALLVVIGRQLLPSLEQRQELINQKLSERFNVQITTEHLSGSWTRLTPRLQAQGLSIALQGDAPAITISSVQSDVDIVRSILNAEIIWHDLSIGEVKLTLREDADGQWSVSNFPIPGFDSDTNSSGQMDILADIILLSTHIGIEQVAIDITFFDGTTTTLYINDTQVESSGGFHRARAKLSLGQEEDSATLLIEGRGNPKNWQHFDGKAYINFNRVNLHNALGLILRSWEPFSTLTETAESNTLLDAELWITSLKPGHFDLRGKVHADEIPLNWNENIPPIKNLDTTLTGTFISGKHWGLQCQNLHFDWGSNIIQPLNLNVQQGLGEHWNEITLSADHINLDTLKYSLVQTQLVGKATANLISTLNPSGQLRGVQLSLDLEKSHPLRQFSAHIEQLSIDSWHSTPAARGVSGYIHWQDDSGYFDIDSGDDFAMRYPGVYTHFMHYGRTQGRLNIDWTSVDSSLQIAGGPIDIRSKEGEIRTYISLDIPTQKNAREPEMFLQAGIKNSHSRHLNNYLPETLNPDLLAWLKRSIGDIDITEAGFIWRGSLNSTSHQQRSIQLYAQLANGEINYDPGWPRLSEFSAHITIDDADFEGVINSGKIGDEPEQAQLDSALIATLPGALLSVKAGINSPLNTAVNSLLKSPLASNVSTLESWEIQGDATAKLDLIIPLSKNRQGESYRVEANIDQGRMQLRSFQPVVFNGLQGRIAYNDSDGLHASGVIGRLWGQALKANITTQNGLLKIKASGLLDLSKAPAWQPLLTNSVTGTTSYTATFTAPDEQSPAQLTLLSDLQGIAIDLPAPLLKLAGQAWPLKASLQFRDTELLIKAGTDKLKAQFSIANQQLANGTITLGEGKTENENSLIPHSSQQHLSQQHASQRKGLLITGHTPVFQLDDWLEALLASSTVDNNIPDFDTRAMVEIDHFSAAGFTLDTITVDALHSKQLWDVDIESPTLAGNIRAPEDREQAIVARLNYITLPTPELNSDQSLLTDLDPRTLPTLDFATDGLRIGDKELGSLAFVMQANKQGVSINHINAEITGITIADTPNGDTAQLLWQRVNGEHRSRFTGALLSDDLGGVLKSWNMPMILTTDSAAFLADLSWQGKPWDLSANAMEGHVALNFNKGRFFQAPGTTTNAALKVIGLINFDTWLRRLKFDFSDLFSSGVNFDHLEGGLTFEQALMRFDEPIVVTLPSGKIHLLGQTNLLEETIDARLIATLPIGTNLPWMVALAGGLPAAAGVYITSKVFEKQVNKFSSISYSVKGNLDNPEVKVGRIFSDKTD
ncbi:TIGR02099 family protein [Gammaproteobacteria bacterium 50_400_T64]|nr:TIGR02099 family protein [Gammaproteobacteria bacterium 50_400_T64]